MSAVIRLKCTLVEEHAQHQRAHLKLVSLYGEFVSKEDDVLSESGKLTVDVPDSSAFTFERDRFYRATIDEEQ